MHAFAIFTCSKAWNRLLADASLRLLGGRAHSHLQPDPLPDPYPQTHMYELAVAVKYNLHIGLALKHRCMCCVGDVLAGLVPEGGRAHPGLACQLTPIVLREILGSH